MREVRSYVRRCKNDGRPINRYWYDKGYDGSQTSSRTGRYAPAADTCQDVRKPIRNSLNDDRDPSLGIPKITLQLISLREGEALGNQPPAFSNALSLSSMSSPGVYIAPEIQPAIVKFFGSVEAYAV